jgi:hypothetical protein
MAGAAVVALAVAFTIRAIDDGAAEQYSGTALYASLVWTCVVFVRPRVGALTAGVIAVGFCWAMEFFQLTGVPATLSAQSRLARLVFGVQFDWTDIAWYPVGVIPLVAAHLVLRSRQRSRRQSAAAEVGS